MGWLLAGLFVLMAGIVNITGEVPFILVPIGLALTAFGAFRIYKKYFAKF